MKKNHLMIDDICKSQWCHDRGKVFPSTQAVFLGIAPWNHNDLLFFRTSKKGCTRHVTILWNMFPWYIRIAFSTMVCYNSKPTITKLLVKQLILHWCMKLWLFIRIFSRILIVDKSVAKIFFIKIIIPISRVDLMGCGISAKAHEKTEI